MTRYDSPRYRVRRSSLPPRIVTALVVSLTVSALARAQGVSGQGFGYPTGELSSRAQGTAGAIAEIDGTSPLNPAALAIGATGQVYGQYDPELRTLSGPAGSSHTTTARFPNFGAVLPVNGHWVIGVSAATLLDQTWSTQAQRLQTLGTDTVTSTETLKSEGGITDLRGALAYAVNSRLRFGVGGHLFGGSDRVSFLEEFADTLRFRNFTQRTTLNYRGTALSGGVEADILPSLSVAVSGRSGGTARMYSGDTLLTHGRIPDHYAGSLSFAGIPGTLLAFRMARALWSSMNSLSTSGAHAVDATDVSGGIESSGPKLGDRPILLRLGVRRRTLPFQVGTTTVHETSFGGGVGLPFAQNRAVVDVSLLRSARSGVSGVSETAYDFSFGLRVHP